MDQSLSVVVNRRHPSARFVRLYSMDILPNTYGWLRMPRECRERFPISPRVRDPDMHHGTCVTYVSWCMTGSLTSGFFFREKRSFPPFPAHAQPATYVSGKWPISTVLYFLMFMFNYGSCQLHTKHLNIFWDTSQPRCNLCRPLWVGDNDWGIVCQVTEGEWCQNSIEERLITISSITATIPVMTRNTKYPFFSIRPMPYTLNWCSCYSCCAASSLCHNLAMLYYPLSLTRIKNSLLGELWYYDS